VAEAEIEFQPNATQGIVLAGNTPTRLNLVCRNIGAGSLEVEIPTLPPGVEAASTPGGALRKPDQSISFWVTSGSEKTIPFLINQSGISNSTETIRFEVKVRDQQGSFQRDYRGAVVDATWQEKSFELPLTYQRIGLYTQKPSLLYRLDRPRIQQLPLENTGGVEIPVTLQGRNGVLIGAKGVGQRSARYEVTVAPKSTEILEVELTDEAAMTLNTGSATALPTLAIQSAKLPDLPSEIRIQVVRPVSSTRPNNPWIIGIDFGTAKTAASLVRNSARGEIKPEIALWPGENNTSERKVDSVLVYRKPGQRPLFGYRTRNAEKEAGVVRSMKKYLSAEREIVLSNGDRRPVLDVVTDFMREVHGVLRSQEQLKQSGDSGARTIDEALIALSIPVHLDKNLDDRQRQNTELAARNAGFARNDIQFFYEPECAAVDYLLRKQDYNLDLNLGDIVAVFDLGAGTTDICILQVSRENDNPTFTRLAQVGFPFGGDLIDELLADKALKHWVDVANRANIPITYPPIKSPKPKSSDPDKIDYPVTIDKHTETRANAIRALRHDFKEKLRYESDIKTGYEPFLDKRFEFRVTWELIAELFTPYLNMMLTDGVPKGAEIPDSNIESGKHIIGQAIPSVDDRLYEIRKDRGDLKYVLLTGGSSLMPFVADEIQSYFQEAAILPDEETRAKMLNDPEQPHTLNVARGAAARACYRFDSPLPFELTLRLESPDGTTIDTLKTGLAKNSIKGAVTERHHFHLAEHFQGYLNVLVSVQNREPALVFQKLVENKGFESTEMEAQMRYEMDGKVTLSIRYTMPDSTERIEVLQ